MRAVRLSALGILIAAVAIAGCGDGADEDAAVEQAAAVTRDAQTAKVDWSLEAEGFGLPSRVTVEGAGTTSLSAARMSLRFDLSPVLSLAGAPSRRGEARVVVRGGEVFVRPPRGAGLRLPGGARWLGIDLGRALRAAGADAAGLADVLTIDPRAQLAALRAAEAVEEVGPERVGGAQTTRYRGRVDLAEFAEGLPPARRARAKQAIEAFGAQTGGEQAQPFEVWVDEADRIRRMTQRAEVPGQPSVPRGEVAITMELSGFGADVSAEPPAAGETYDATRTVSDALAASQ